MMYDNIPEELKNLNQWVCVLSNSKVPMKAWESTWASSTNPNTWSSFSTALTSVQRHYYDYLGFVFNNNGIVGIDIDTGYDEYGLINELGADIIGKCKSYTEKSRSGQGFHILLRGNLPFTGRNNLNGVEIYQSSRYFIMTGDVILYDTIIENQAAIDYIIGKYFTDIRVRLDSEIFQRDVIYSPIWEKPVDNGRIKLRPIYPPIQQGCRNISLTSLAGTLHNLGYAKQYIYNELTYANNVACNPPLDTRELRTICCSITKYKRKGVENGKRI